MKQSWEVFLMTTEERRGEQLPAHPRANTYRQTLIFTYTDSSEASLCLICLSVVGGRKEAGLRACKP